MSKRPAGRPASRRAALMSIWLPFVIGTAGFVALALVDNDAPAWRVVAAVVTCTAANVAAVVRALKFGASYGAGEP